MRDLIHNLNIQQKQTEDLTSFTDIKRRELSEKDSDLLLITRENQVLNQELMKIKNEKDDVESNINLVKVQNQELSHQVKANEIEKQDLLQIYRKTCEDLDGNKNKMDSISHDHQDM